MGRYVHCYAPKPWGPTPGDRFVGHLMAEAVNAGLEPMALLPQWVNAVTQMDCWWIDGDSPETERCYAHFPQITLLDNLVSSYPAARFILCYRSTESWLRSVTAYGPMRRILNDADLPGLPSGVGSDEDLGHWFEDHIKRVRHYFETSELAGALLELELEKDDQFLTNAHWVKGVPALKGPRSR